MTGEHTVVGPYELLRVLGRGGMATVHLARQRRLDRLVALKELDGLLAGDPSIARRFLLEAHMAGALSHPNIVTGRRPTRGGRRPLPGGGPQRSPPRDRSSTGRLDAVIARADQLDQRGAAGSAPPWASRSLSSAAASIWRTRSALSPSARAIARSVVSVPSKPKR